MLGKPCQPAQVSVIFMDNFFLEKNFIYTIHGTFNSISLLDYEYGSF